MYQEIKSSVTNKVACIKRLEDSASIPIEPASTDYQEYLKWLAEGNGPLPADAPEQPA